MTPDSPFAPSWDPLAVDPDTMRALGHRTVDLLVDLLTDPQTRCLTRATPAEMERRLPVQIPDAPRPYEELLDQLQEDVLPFMSRLDHPGYFAFIPACGTFPAALGEFIDAVLNPYVGTWMEAAGPSRLELVVLEWFKRWIGYPAEAAGVLVSGGSAANMTALACAREARLGPMTADAVLYVSDQGHSSLARAARLLGFRPEQVRVIPADAAGRLVPDAVAAAIDADRAAGLRPLALAAAAGTTNRGAVDPLGPLAEVCRARDVWLHVDGAYGAFASLTARGRAALRGIELADSVTLDPHKWLYQPFECGAVLVRDGRLLEAAFAIAPDYLKDAVPEAEVEVNFADRGLQLSRGANALKIWLSVSYFGADAFRAAIDRCLNLAQLAEHLVRRDPALELLSPASLGVICFRRHVPGAGEEETARVNAALVAAYERTGQGLVSSTRLRGRYAIRVCVMNHTSGAEHVRAVLDWFANAPVPDPAGDEQDDRATAPVAPAGAALDPAALDLVAAAAHEREVAAGEPVMRQWDTSRDFYVVVEGQVAVERDGHAVGVVGPGEFFGELAALDWGAGYGYARLATVTAIEPTRLLVLTPGALADLMTDAPALDRRIREAVRERLVTTAG